jgi:CheY-like chemotaxis protein
MVLDARMPDMDGFETVETMRQHSELNEVRIIMLTSAGERGDTTRCRQLGIPAYLMKPARQSELFSSICSVLGAKTSRVISEPLREPPDAQERHAPLRVLLAEDNPVNQKIAVWLLEKRGHSVILAGTGKEALELLESRDVDLVLMDIQMPELDGLETTAMIRDRERISGRHVPVFAMTAHAMKGDYERCIHSGMDGYMTKPIRAKDLDSILLEVSTGSCARPAAPKH